MISRELLRVFNDTTNKKVKSIIQEGLTKISQGQPAEKIEKRLIRRISAYQAQCPEVSIFLHTRKASFDVKSLLTEIKETETYSESSMLRNMIDGGLQYDMPFKTQHVDQLFENVQKLVTHEFLNKYIDAPRKKYEAVKSHMLVKETLEELEKDANSEFLSEIITKLKYTLSVPAYYVPDYALTKLMKFKGAHSALDHFLQEMKHIDKTKLNRGMEKIQSETMTETSESIQESISISYRHGQERFMYNGSVLLRAGKTYLSDVGREAISRLPSDYANACEAFSKLRPIAPSIYKLGNSEMSIKIDHKTITLLDKDGVPTKKPSLVAGMEDNTLAQCYNVLRNNRKYIEVLPSFVTVRDSNKMILTDSMRGYRVEKHQSLAAPVFKKVSKEELEQENKSKKPTKRAKSINPTLYKVYEDINEALRVIESSGVDSSDVRKHKTNLLVKKRRILEELEDGHGQKVEKIIEGICESMEEADIDCEDGTCTIIPATALRIKAVMDAVDSDDRAMIYERMCESVDTMQKMAETCLDCEDSMQGAQQLYEMTIESNEEDILESLDDDAKSYYEDLEGFLLHNEVEKEIVEKNSQYLKDLATMLSKKEDNTLNSIPDEYKQHWVQLSGKDWEASYYEIYPDAVLEIVSQKEESAVGHQIAKEIGFPKSGDKFKTGWGDKTSVGLLKSCLNAISAQDKDLINLISVLPRTSDSRYRIATGVKTYEGVKSTIQRIIDDSKINESADPSKIAERLMLLGFDQDEKIVHDHTGDSYSANFTKEKDGVEYAVVLDDSLPDDYRGVMLTASITAEGGHQFHFTFDYIPSTDEEFMAMCDMMSDYADMPSDEQLNDIRKVLSPIESGTNPVFEINWNKHNAEMKVGQKIAELVGFPEIDRDTYETGWGEKSSRGIVSIWQTAEASSDLEGLLENIPQKSGKYETAEGLMSAKELATAVQKIFDDSKIFEINWNKHNAEMKIGQQIAELVGFPEIDRDTYETGWGEKSSKGIYLTWQTAEASSELEGLLGNIPQKSGKYETAEGLISAKELATAVQKIFDDSKVLESNIIEGEVYGIQDYYKLAEKGTSMMKDNVAIVTELSMSEGEDKFTFTLPHDNMSEVTVYESGSEMMVEIVYDDEDITDIAQVMGISDFENQIGVDFEPTLEEKSEFKKFRAWPIRNMTMLVDRAKMSNEVEVEQIDNEQYDISKNGKVVVRIFLNPSAAVYKSNMDIDKFQTLLGAREFSEITSASDRANIANGLSKGSSDPDYQDAINNWAETGDMESIEFAAKHLEKRMKDRERNEFYFNLGLTPDPTGLHLLMESSDNQAIFDKFQKDMGAEAKVSGDNIIYQFPDEESYKNARAEFLKEPKEIQQMLNHYNSVDNQIIIVAESANDDSMASALKKYIGKILPYENHLDNLVDTVVKEYEKGGVFSESTQERWEEVTAESIGDSIEKMKTSGAIPESMVNESISMEDVMKKIRPFVSDGNIEKGILDYLDDRAESLTSREMDILYNRMLELSGLNPSNYNNKSIDEVEKAIVKSIAPALSKMESISESHSVESITKVLSEYLQDVHAPFAGDNTELLQQIAKEWIADKDVSEDSKRKWNFITKGEKLYDTMIEFQELMIESSHNGAINALGGNVAGLLKKAGHDGAPAEKAIDAHTEEILKSGGVSGEEDWMITLANDISMEVKELVNVINQEYEELEDEILNESSIQSGKYTFGDGHTVRTLSMDLARELYEKEEIFAIDRATDSETLIEEAADIDKAEMIGIDTEVYERLKRDGVFESSTKMKTHKFKDGYELAIISQDTAKKLHNQYEVFRINMAQDSESVVTDESELYGAPALGIEVDLYKELVGSGAIREGAEGKDKVVDKFVKLYNSGMTSKEAMDALEDHYSTEEIEKASDELAEVIGSLNESVKVNKDVQNDSMDYHKHILKALESKGLTPVDINAFSDDMRGDGDGEIAFVNSKGESFKLEYEVESDTQDMTANVGLYLQVKDSDGAELTSADYTDSMDATSVYGWMTEKTTEMLNTNAKMVTESMDTIAYVEDKEGNEVGVHLIDGGEDELEAVVTEPNGSKFQVGDTIYVKRGDSDKSVFGMVMESTTLTDDEALAMFRGDKALQDIVMFFDKPPKNDGENEWWVGDAKDEDMLSVELVSGADYDDDYEWVLKTGEGDFIAGIKNGKLINESSSENYEVYHESYGSALDEIISFAEKRGVELDMDDYDTNFLDAFFKPKEGETKTAILSLEKDGKSVKDALSVQIHNMGTKFELNMHIN